MTLIVVWLLQIPGLLFVGGAVLVWIAYKLLLPRRVGRPLRTIRTASVPPVSGAPMRTIVVADAVMGLDNVLAVAGAAHGSYVLVVAGLLISVPIVVWGSSLLLKWVERYPVIVYFGAGVLAYTAVKMMVHEPLVRGVGRNAVPGDARLRRRGDRRRSTPASCATTACSNPASTHG
jgi:YjbE family integral membrane protein